MDSSISVLETFQVNNKPICVLSSLSDSKVAQENGIYELEGDIVKNIHYMPDTKTLLSVGSTNNLYNMVNILLDNSQSK